MKRIITGSPCCTGLPRHFVPRNDLSAPYPRHHKERIARRGNPVQAFSLIELLISLIIISLITSAFIPILTSKLKHQNTTLSSSIIDCKKFGSECILCDKTSCTLCSTQINLEEGFWVDSKTSCEIKKCPKNCISCKNDMCLKCEDEYELTDGKCERKSCIEIGNICVEKYNAGDEGGLIIPDNLVEFIDVKETGVSGTEHNRAICYRGKSANECDSTNSNYSGCNRTVCSWYAAVKICQYYGLRLPSAAEAYNFGNWSTELQLCNNQANSKNMRCQQSSKCPLADSTGICVPDAVWCQRNDGLNAPPNSSSRNGGVNFRLNGSWDIELSGTHNCNSGGYSVRCVKDL